MTAIDEIAINKSFELINKYGKPLVYKQKTQGAYDVNTGTYPIVETSQDIVGFITKPKVGEINTGIATAEDSIILVASKSLNVVPNKEDIISINGNDIQINNFSYVYSGFEICLFKFVCKLR